VNTSSVTISAPIVFKRILSVGSQGNDVKALQTILKQKGFLAKKVVATGYYGAQTKEAVKKYQKDANFINQTGKIDTNTLKVINGTQAVASSTFIVPSVNSITDSFAADLNSQPTKNVVNPNGLPIITNCVTSSNSGLGSLSLDINSPASKIVLPGSSNVEIARIDLTNTGSGNICLNGIHLGSSSNLNNFVTNTRVIDVSTGLQLGQATNGFEYNGSYYYDWIYPVPSVSVPIGSTKVFKIVSDFPSTTSQGSFVAGIWGLNFDFPGATVAPQVVNGNLVTISQNITPLPPIADINSITPSGDITPRVMFWWGKVNQHVDVNGNWQTDADGVSGANLDRLTYCKKYFPNTASIEDYKIEGIGSWKDAGNVQNPNNPSSYYYTLKMSTKCVQGNSVVDPVSLTVLSPNGGETWLKNTIQTIKWQDNETYTCKVGQLCDPLPRYYDINLVPYYTPCTGGKCPMMPIRAPFEIARTISGSSYSWNVGASASVDLLPDGSYQMQVCKAGKDVCDLSDSYFKIVSSNFSTPSITVLSPNGGETYTAGQKIEVKWSNTGLSSEDVTVDLFGDSNNMTSGFGMVIVGMGSIHPKVGTGSYVVTLPSQVEWPSMQYGLHYKIVVTGIQSGIQDWSDSLFTINDSGIYPTPTPSPTPIPVPIPTPTPTPLPPAINPSGDTTPRIMYWSGKINQHVDINGNWQTDADGVSGANLDRLTYCKKYFPNTTSTENYKLETIVGWRNAGNTGEPFTSIKMSTKCVQGGVVNYDTLATCIKDKGAVFYGTFWCPHCQNQKKLFGASESLLPYVECSTQDGKGQTQICIDKNIQGYPTWTFADGTSLGGEQTLQTLASKTSCALPQ